MIIGISINTGGVIELHIATSVYRDEGIATSKRANSESKATRDIHRVYRVPKAEYLNWLLATSSDFFALLRRIPQNETDMTFFNFAKILGNSSEISTEAEATRRLFVTLLHRRNTETARGTSTGC